MNRLGKVAVRAALFLAAFGAALAWALGADAVEGAGCMLPAAAVAVLGFTSQADRQQWTGPAVASAEAVLTLLAAIVTRSGYAWQPLLFGKAV